jgi:hypothetical protein
MYYVCFFAKLTQVASVRSCLDSMHSLVVSHECSSKNLVSKRYSLKHAFDNSNHTSRTIESYKSYDQIIQVVRSNHTSRTKPKQPILERFGLLLFLLKLSHRAECLLAKQTCQHYCLDAHGTHAHKSSTLWGSSCSSWATEQRFPHPCTTVLNMTLPTYPILARFGDLCWSAEVQSRVLVQHPCTAMVESCDGHAPNPGIICCFHSGWAAQNVHSLLRLRRYC